MKQWGLRETGNYSWHREYLGENIKGGGQNLKALVRGLWEIRTKG